MTSTIATVAAEHDSANKATTQLGRLGGVAGFLARRVSNIFVATWEKDFPAFGIQITPVQAGILVLIDENPGITQAEVAQLLAVEGPTLVQSISMLADAGLVSKSRRSEDRRALALELREEARPLLAEIGQRLKKREQIVLAPLSPEERKTLIGLLQRVMLQGPVR